MKIDWKRKLTSRKLWVAVAGFVAGLIVIFGGSQQEADRVSGTILSGASVVAYILGEGFADAANGGCGNCSNCGNCGNCGNSENPGKNQDDCNGD